MTEFQAAYLKLMDQGELEARVAEARQMLAECRLCGRQCAVNRLESASGAACRTGERAVVSSFNAHYGEEDPLVGEHGSGTIFFANCNLKCQYCQNYEISQLGEGREVEAEELAAMMLHLQGRGCHNINFVSPTHVIPQILEGLLIAAQKGLRLPLVHNTGGYDSLEALRILDGVIDIYMPDMKYAETAVAADLSDALDYPQVNRTAVSEMHRQVGDLVVENGLAVRGLLVRHLVLPNRLAGSAAVIDFLAEHVSDRTAINIMDQYRPCYQAVRCGPIMRRPRPDEIEEVIDHARQKNLRLLER